MRQKRKNQLSIFLFILAFLLLAFYFLWPYVQEYREQDQLPNSISFLPEEPKEVAVSPIDFASLLDINADTIAWITIPGTNIDGPVVQTDNNETYLKKNFRGEKSNGGAIYLDYECQPDMSGRHVIIYGHNFGRTGLFHDIVNYKKEDFWQQNAKITIYTPDREIHLQIIACQVSASKPIYRKTQFADDAEWQSYVQDRLNENRYENTIKAEEITQLYSFITCSYEFDNARTMIHAIEIPQEK